LFIAILDLRTTLSCLARLTRFKTVLTRAQVPLGNSNALIPSPFFRFRKKPPTKVAPYHGTPPRFHSARFIFISRRTLFPNTTTPARLEKASKKPAQNQLKALL
jgi:hypothetical protein